MDALILLLVIVLPIAWLAAEFTSSRLARIGLGCASLLLAFGVAAVVGSLDRIDANAFYGAATKDLVQNTIEQLEQGNTERVVAELRRLRAEFEPSYETRDNYDQLVRQYVQQVSDDPVIHDAGSVEWRDG